MSPLEELLAQAQLVGATVMRTPAVVVLIVPLAPSGSTAHGEWVPVAAAAHLAATTVRVLRDAVRRGELTAFGGQRDRAVRRADLDRWMADRRVTPVAGPADKDVERRMARLARSRKRRAA